MGMQHGMMRNSFHFKKDGAKRHPQIFNLQSSIFNSGSSELGNGRQNDCNIIAATGSLGGLDEFFDLSMDIAI